MSSHPVADVRAHRGLKRRRLELATALYSGDPTRHLLVAELVRILSLTNADRAAVVWVDDFGPPDVRAFALLDSGSDRPRRSFPLEPLSEAWRMGVPSLLETVEADPAHGVRNQLVAVALGSDGLRLWWVVATRRRPGRPLTPAQRAEMFHAAGRCSGVVLHRDLEPGSGSTAMAGRRRPRFPGWGILQDFGDDPVPADVERRIGLRFVVARLVGLMVEDGVAFPGNVETQVERAREELAKEASGDPELPAWEAVLSALEAHDAQALGGAALTLARRAHAEGHCRGTLEIGSWVMQIAAATGEGPMALDAASEMTSACRDLSIREEEARWARVTQAVRHALHA